MRRTLYTLGALALAFILPAGTALAQSFGGAVAVSGGEVFVAESQNEQHPGTVYVYRPGSDGWEQATSLEASDAMAGDNFGVGMAVDGMNMIVGAPAANDGAGAAYVFTKQGMTWAETARLSVMGADSEMPIGGALALRGDIALVGQPSADSARGAVHVFMNNNGTWTHTGEPLLASDAMAGDRFGGTVALSESGTTAYVGATRKGESTGAVYVYDWADGAWTQSAMIAGSNSEEGDRFGGTIVTYGDDLLMVTSMRYQQMMGQGYTYMRDAETGEYNEVGRIAPFDGATRTLFGASADFDGETLVVGALGENGFAGTTYVMEFDPESMTWMSAEKVMADDLGRRGLFGMASAIDGEWMVVGASGADGGAGSAYIFREGPEGWMVDAKLEGPIRGMDAITGEKAECSDSDAAGFDCGGMDLMAFIPLHEMGGGRGTSLNDIWGWTDPETGREWALVGRSDGTSFVDVTDPMNPVYAGDLPLTEGASPASWRDVKVYSDHAYIVADNSGEHGMQVFDLTRLRSVTEPMMFDEDFVYAGVNSAHNVFINEDTGFAYIVGAGGGGETCGGGLHMVNIQNPKEPTFAGCFADTETGRRGTGYSHDVQCVLYNGPDADYQGKEICLGSNETALSIADVTDKANPVALSSAPYPNVGYSHQGWLTDDHRYFYMNDELDEMQGNVSNTRTLIWDLADLEDPQLLKEFMHETTSSDHNLYIQGNLMYQSNYAEGVRVFDISDVANPTLVGHFDTTSYGEDGPSFIGSWSNYPYFRSGTIIATSIGEGLFVLKKQNLDI